jgi:hypothetical protein
MTYLSSFVDKTHMLHVGAKLGTNFEFLRPVFGAKVGDRGVKTQKFKI